MGLKVLTLITWVTSPILRLPRATTLSHLISISSKGGLHEGQKTLLSLRKFQGFAVCARNRGQRPSVYLNIPQVHRGRREEEVILMTTDNFFEET